MCWLESQLGWLFWLNRGLQLPLDLGLVVGCVSNKMMLLLINAALRDGNHASFYIALVPPC